jgi:hypothetical protein
MSARVGELQELWDSWNNANEPPRWIDNRWNSLEQTKVRKQNRKPERT